MEELEIAVLGKLDKAVLGQLVYRRDAKNVALGPENLIEIRWKLDLGRGDYGLRLFVFERPKRHELVLLNWFVKDLSRDPEIERRRQNQAIQLAQERVRTEKL